MKETGESEFQNQFSEKCFTKDYDRGTVTVLRITPDSIKKDSGTEQTALPLLFAHGFGGDKTLPWYLKAFAKTGRDAFGVGFIGKRRTNSTRFVDIGLKNKDGENIKVPKLELEKTEDIIAAMDELGIQQTDIVAFSAGALRTMIAVALHPDRFRNVLLVHPGGMDDNGTLITHGHVVKNQLRSIIDPKMFKERFQRKKGRLGMEEKEKLRYVGKGSLWMRAEQRSVGKARFHSLIPKLVEAYPHLRFSMIADKNDYNFSHRRLRKVNEESIFEFITSNWKGHGIGPNQDRIEEINNVLIRMEKGEKQTNNSKLGLKRHRRLLGKPQS